MRLENRKPFAVILVFAMTITVIMGRFAFFGTPVPNVSAVTTTMNLGVYSDRNCTQLVYSIDWGILYPGGFENVVTYVRNEGNESFVLALTPLNWNPENASRYLDFSWTSEDKKVDAGQVVKVTQSLYVFPYVSGISSFRFDIFLEGREYFLGDTDRDGDVDFVDFSILRGVYGSTPTSNTWNPKADVNNDGVVDFYDLKLLYKNYGKYSAR